ncbi:hypothetical protein K491DRAFT_713238 [Lophiostoma macrostomum CBS 122681]|uniref:Uncharacterized protein n=1 Tax=Lophiostoma macrostomum CBS 122681 TaxID=1314788 RepID=A0A6A6TJI3_9PLEO|nr:hypothetical protein K491DRAFT_713238 [Lophiostoma macrostomum CBS 122681]
MGQDENFCGDRLRLAAFLRVVDSVPERPSRFRRRLPEGGNEHETGHGNITAGPSSIEMLALGQSPSSRSSPTARTTTGERQTDDSLHTPVSATDDAAIPQDDDPVQDEPFSIPKAQSTTTNSHGSESTTLQSSSKGVVVYTSSATKTDPRGKAASGTRKRRLPVNELPLVRTTTEDGLPDRSEDDAQVERCITEEDPIEETAEPFLGRTQQLVSRGASTPKLPTRRPQRPLIKKAIAQDRKKKAKALTHAKSAQYCFDGFVGEELSIPSNPKRKVTVVSKERAVPAERHLPATIGGLCFASGLLPLPSDLQVTIRSDQLSEMRQNTSRLNGLPPLTTLDLNEIEIEIERDKSIAQAVRHAEPEQPMSKEEVALREAVMDVAIATQLSSVTAPSRKEESESSDEEASYDEQTLSDSESLGPLSSDDDDSTATDQQATSARRSLSPSVSLSETGGYYQQASHFLDNTMVDDGHEFWSQYGHTD